MFSTEEPVAVPRSTSQLLASSVHTHQTHLEGTWTTTFSCLDHVTLFRPVRLSHLYHASPLCHASLVSTVADFLRTFHWAEEDSTKEEEEVHQQVEEVQEEEQLDHVVFLGRVPSHVTPRPSRSHVASRPGASRHVACRHLPEQEEVPWEALVVPGHALATARTHHVTSPSARDAVFYRPHPGHNLCPSTCQTAGVYGTVLGKEKWAGHEGSHGHVEGSHVNLWEEDSLDHVSPEEDNLCPWEGVVDPSLEEEGSRGLVEEARGG